MGRQEEEGGGKRVCSFKSLPGRAQHARLPDDRAVATPAPCRHLKESGGRARGGAGSGAGRGRSRRGGARALPSARRGCWAGPLGRPFPAVGGGKRLVGSGSKLAATAPTKPSQLLPLGNRCRRDASALSRCPGGGDPVLGPAGGEGEREGEAVCGRPWVARAAPPLGGKLAGGGRGWKARGGRAPPVRRGCPRPARGCVSVEAA